VTSLGLFVTCISRVG